MHQATQPKVRLPYAYKGFYLTRSHGRLYGIPPFLDADELHYRKRLHIHPAVLSASTEEVLTALVDTYDAAPYVPEVIDDYEGYDVVRLGETLYGVPQSAGVVDLNLEEERRRVSVISGASREEIRNQIRAAMRAV